MAQWDMPTIFFLLLKDGILFNEIGSKGIHKYVFYSLSVKKEKSCYIDTVLYGVCKEALKPNKKIDSAIYPPRLGWFGNFISAALMALTLLVWPKPDRYLISSPLHLTADISASRRGSFLGNIALLNCDYRSNAEFRSVTTHKSQCGFDTVANKSTMSFFHCILNRLKCKCQRQNPLPRDWAFCSVKNLENTSVLQCANTGKHVTSLADWLFYCHNALDCGKFPPAESVEKHKVRIKGSKYLWDRPQALEYLTVWHRKAFVGTSFKVNCAPLTVTIWHKYTLCSPLTPRNTSIGKNDCMT